MDRANLLGAGNARARFVRQPAVPGTLLGQTIVRGLDNFIAFIALVRSIAIRNIKIIGNGDPTKSLMSLLRIVLVGNAHVWLFWTLGRQVPGNIPYTVFYIMGYGTWSFFALVQRCSPPPALLHHYSKNLDHKWIHLYIAAISWECCKVLLAVTLSIGFYWVFPVRFLGPLPRFPNIPLLFCTYAISTVLGVGFGLFFDSLKQRVPLMEMIHEPLFWAMFVLSGVYGSYILLPAEMAEYIWYLPSVPLIEFSRKAMVPGYPTGDLSLWYSAACALALLFAGLGLRNWELKSRHK
jgi:capsular polysaccharide transport system permease protein